MLFWDNLLMSPKDLTIWRVIGQEVVVSNSELNPKGIVQILIILMKEKGLTAEGIMRDHPVSNPKTHC